MNLRRSYRDVVDGSLTRSTAVRQVDRWFSNHLPNETMSRGIVLSLECDAAGFYYFETLKGDMENIFAQTFSHYLYTVFVLFVHFVSPKSLQ